MQGEDAMEKILEYSQQFEAQEQRAEAAIRARGGPAMAHFSFGPTSTLQSDTTVRTNYFRNVTDQERALARIRHQMAKETRHAAEVLQKERDLNQRLIEQIAQLRQRDPTTIAHAVRHPRRRHRRTNTARSRSNRRNTNSNSTTTTPRPTTTPSTTTTPIVVTPRARVGTGVLPPARGTNSYRISTTANDGTPYSPDAISELRRMQEILQNKDMEINELQSLVDMYEDTEERFKRNDKHLREEIKELQEKYTALQTDLHQAQVDVQVHKVQTTNGIRNMYTTMEAVFDHLESNGYDIGTLLAFDAITCHCK